MFRNLLAAGLAIILFVSCGNKGGDKTSSTGEKSAGSGKVLAKVDGNTLTLDDILYQVPAEQRDQFRGPRVDGAVEGWINTVLLYDKALKMGLDKDPQVKAIIDFSTKNALAQRLVELEIAQKIGVSPSAVDSVYATQKENFKSDKDRMRASHILMNTREEAEAIYNRLKKGDKFADLAREYSIDKQTSASGGDVGYFDYDQMARISREFAETASKLKIGQYSEPVKSMFGYHLIMLTDIQKAGAYFDSLEVKKAISDSLLQARQDAALNAMIDSLRQKAKIERFSASEAPAPATMDSL